MKPVAACPVHEIECLVLSYIWTSFNVIIAIIVMQVQTSVIFAKFSTVGEWFDVISDYCDRMCFRFAFVCNPIIHKDNFADC